MTWAGILDFAIFIAIMVLLFYAGKWNRARRLRRNREAFDHYYRQYENEITSTMRQAEGRARESKTGDDDGGDDNKAD
jgi:hypothetical protein